MSEGSHHTRARLMRKFPPLARTITTATETAKTQQRQQQLIKLNRQLSSLTRSTQYDDAIHLFRTVLSSHFHLKPDHYTLSTTLTACSHLRDLNFGSNLHGYAVKTGLKAHLHVANSLLSLYAKGMDVGLVEGVFGEIECPDVYSYTTLLSVCAKTGQVGYACEVFDKMPQRDVAVWNAMITGCVESGNREIGFRLFRDMCRYGARHDNYSFASVLSGCNLELVDFGRQVHSLVMKTGFLVRTTVLNSLITMYFNGGNVSDAFSVFDEVEDSVLDRITYNVIIDGLVTVGRVEDAFVMFREMLVNSLRPTELTFVSVISSSLSAVVGRQVHAHAIKMGFEACTSVSNAAITMYSSSGDPDAAYLVFDRLAKKDLVSWNTMISTCAQGDDSRSAILAYMEMQREGIEPDEYTFGSLLVSSELIETVKIIHALVFRNGLFSSIQVSNALVSAYCKVADLTQAHQIFCSMIFRNLISWNTIISGLLLNGLPMQGLELFSELLKSELRPNEYTLSLAFSICATISALRHGKQVHGCILKVGFSRKGSLCNALVTMYAKCGLLDWSLRVFDAMTERDVVSWNALISACAQHGQGKEAVRCFEAMQNSSGLRPDQTTFISVLSACSHAGLVDDGSRIFNSMIDKYGIVPGVDHYSCIIDLLGRAGCFDEVERIMNSTLFEPHPNIWWTLFSACVAHGNLKLGRLVAGFLLEMEPDNPSIYVLLSKVYAAAGQWEEAAKIRDLIDDSELMKQPGYSWISS